MVHALVVKLITALVILGLLGGSTSLRAGSLETVADTRKLLAAMDDVGTDSHRLAALFRVGDTRLKELIQLLDDPDPKMKLRAQVVIRYVGNESGMQALREWYSRQEGGYGIAGPIPLPLAEWDYHSIEVNLLATSPQTWRDRGVQYIYALALDGSPRAKAVLADLIKKADGLDESNFIGYAIKRVQLNDTKRLLAGKDLATLVLSNAFFIAPEDRKYTSARVLAFNRAKDKALVEVYINRGKLAEEWYHIVLRRCDQGWKFFSITPIAVS